MAGRRQGHAPQPPPAALLCRGAKGVLRCSRPQRTEARLRLLQGRARPAMGGKACGAYLVVLGLTIICFMKAIAGFVRHREQPLWLVKPARGPLASLLLAKAEMGALTRGSGY